MTMLTAISAASFINSLGVNTHIDFDNYGYQNLSTVESSLEYLGVKNVRDSGPNNSDLTTWLQVSQATGVKFDDYMPEGSAAAMQTDAEPGVATRQGRHAEHDRGRQRGRRLLRRVAGQHAGRPRRSSSSRSMRWASSSACR